VLQASRNHRFAEVILIFIGVVNFARGLFHYLAPDSGAHSVAGMDTASAAGANSIYLLAAIGAMQFVNGLLFIYIALKQKQMVLSVFWYLLLMSSMVLLLNFVFKQPALPVPGRFANMAEFIIVLATICVIICLEKRDERKGS
jgi:lipid-A-disaccharide synthase-like uncharacterized protein